MALLKLENIGKIYDSNDILTIGIRGVNLEFDYNEFVIIEGESGSGKSTLLNVIGANDSYEEGELYFDGLETSHYSESEWEKYRDKNIATIFQDFNIIENLTVLENVMVGGFVHTNKTAESRRIAEEVLRTVGMDKIANRRAKDLTLPQRKRLEIAKALATHPKLLLLDEVLAGLNPTEIEEAVGLIRQINATGISVLMIEHVLQATMAICSRIYVLDYGKPISTGTPHEVTSNPDVIKAYLGDDYE